MGEHNLEKDFMDTQWLKDKVRNSDAYAQNLYAAMCNTDFIKAEVMPILKEEYWSCSWRHAGAIIAAIRCEGDYMDWYCSGIGPSTESGYVSECTVTNEIREDLLKMGWIIKQYQPEDWK